MEREPHKAIREWVENGGAKKWKHSDLARELYAMSTVMRMYWFERKEEGQYEMPQPLVAIDKMRVETLAAYHLVENPLGLKYQITLNERYVARPKYSIFESLAHEMVHLYMEENPDPKAPKCKTAGYHLKEFVEVCEQIGLHPRLGSGAHWRIADGQFAKLMERVGVEKPEESSEVPPEDKKTNWWNSGTKTRGSSTLILYTNLSCLKKPICKIRSGRSDLHIICGDCLGEFQAQP